MKDNELLLIDRIGVIKQTIAKYGEDKFYISFSGGKDSTCLHYLIDLAIPGNKIPRVYINTGIEYNDVVKFVEEMASKDNRIVIVKPTKPIIETLNKVGGPFKSKNHSKIVYTYQKNGLTKSVNVYLEERVGWFKCPKVLRYQFTPEYKLLTSASCCMELKKKPAHKGAKENNKPITITGMLAEEGGSRARLVNRCIILDKNGVARHFHPMIKVNKEGEKGFIAKYNIQLCKLYYPPYNFDRTGCKGCPFSLELQQQLDIMEKLLPAEKKQCEYIGKPVYEEYRRLGYRLRKAQNENKDS